MKKRKEALGAGNEISTQQKTQASNVCGDNWHTPDCTIITTDICILFNTFVLLLNCSLTFKKPFL